ncbi:EF-hand domain-containing protein [Cinnamomum micranthum f. kanehirae]|uniref:EF-hand domain-containing protein n=1 Tax=Cinnamomum micranthum f. kanehirae TaxID=337451 RepID=A0A443PFU5_9MAGN|nr:EF-hand domain-containing protein [Cinnamomum micranthum f. kanehirae]
MAKAAAFLFLSLLLLLSISAQSRLVPDTSSNSNLISDGIFHEPPLLFLESSPPFETCKQAYGILPCSTTFWGNLLIVLLYGSLTFFASKYISSGSELLLEILGPGFAGGVFVPIVDALPNAIVILVSGLSGTKETAQKQVQIGMGLLAGSTVMLLTSLWGSCVVVGKCDLVNSTSSDSQDSKRFSLTGSGVTTDEDTGYTSRIMIISVIPFIVVQLPQVFHISSGSRIAVLISLFLAVAFLISYCAYQVVRPWIQKRRVEYVKRKHIMSGVLRHMHKTAMGRLLDENGKPNKPVIDKLFHRLDLNHDEHVSSQELTALIIGIDFLNKDLDKEDAADKVMEDFDTSGDRRIDEKEFLNGISKWLEEAKSSVVQGGTSTKEYDDFHMKTWEEYYEMAGSHDENAEGVKTPTRVSIKAGLMLLLGTVIAAAFADPLVDSVTNFSNATNIPSFFISFIAMPLATNSSEAVSAIIFASRKKQRTTSLTFSEIYGGVTTNNLICLAVFLALVYVRHLTWDFSAEVLVILIVCIVMGLLTSLSTTFPLWTCFVAYLLYPFSLVLVYVLKWS